jgi:hypothetical protein
MPRSRLLQIRTAKAVVWSMAAFGENSRIPEDYSRLLLEVGFLMLQHELHEGPAQPFLRDAATSRKAAKICAGSSSDLD